MTATDRALQELDTAIRARIPVVGIQTTEEQRIVEYVRAISARPVMSLTSDEIVAPERIVLRWTHTGGVEVNRPKFLDADGVVEPLPEALERRYTMAETYWMGAGKTNQPFAAVADFVTWATGDGTGPDMVDRASVLMMHDMHRFLGMGGGEGDPASVRSLRDLFYGLLSTKSYAVITAPNMGSLGDSGKEVIVIDWPLPDVTELVAMVRATADKVQDTIPVGDDILNGGAEILAQALTALTWTQAGFVLRQAMVTARELSVEKCGPVVSAMKATILKQEQGIELIEPEPISDVAGLDLLKAAVKDYPKLLTQAARDAHVSLPQAILFCGPAGTGKSLACKTIGSGLLPILRWSPAETKNKWLGDTAKNVRAVLNAADAINACVLWMDEIDLLFSDSEGQHETSNETQQMLLTWMQERKSQVIVCATTNHPDRLPAPLRDRFEDRWYVDLPRNREEAVRVFEIHLNKRGLGGIVKDSHPQLLELAAATVRGSLNPRGIEQGIKAAHRLAWGEGRDLDISGLQHEIGRRVKMSQRTAEVVEKMRSEAQAWAMAASSAVPDAESVGDSLGAIDV
jgi:AAA+ superfamily predicted ATPase